MSLKIDKEQIVSAVSTLISLSNVKESNNGKTKLFEESDMLHLIIGQKKAPNKFKMNPILIEIPHTIYNDPSICLFVPEPYKTYKELIESNPIEGLDKIIGLDKLRTRYSSFKLRRELLSTYDLFLCDSRILLYMTKLLGKIFINRKKHPINVNWKTSKQLKEKINKIKQSTPLYLGWGICCDVKCGSTQMDSNEIVENVLAIVDSITKSIPIDNIQSISLKTNDSLSLPLYSSLPN